MGAKRRIGRLVCNAVSQIGRGVRKGGVLVSQVKLKPDTIAVIEKIVQSGHNAKVTTGKDGITVYEEKVKKVHIEKAQS